MNREINKLKLYRTFSFLLEFILYEVISWTSVIILIKIIVPQDFFIFMFILMLYYPVRLSLSFINEFILTLITNGSSLGKLIVGLKVINIDESTSSPSRLFFRWIINVLVFYILNWIGSLFQLVVIYNSPIGQSIHDHATDTKIIFRKVSFSKKLILISSYVTVVSLCLIVDLVLVFQLIQYLLEI